MEAAGNDSATAPFQVGAQVGPYRLEALLGVGGMGQVFRARDSRLGRVVAIKTSHEPFDARFEREARTVARLNHPHICTLHDVGANYLVMELIEGATLADRLRRGALPLATVLKYGAQIADALATAHAKGVTHRDLKPQNIMVAKSGVKVLDFGIAKVAEEVSLTQTQQVLGTLAYMAPEQRAGRPADARSDIYALGLVLREMAVGPEANDASAIANPQLAQTIQRCLAADPDDRWQSARDLQGALDLIGVAGSVTPPRVRGSRTWLVAASAVIVALVAGTALWLRPALPERVLRYTLAAPSGTTFLTIAEAGAPALSPNGRAIAFVAQGTGGRALWVRSLDSLDARPLPGTENAGHVFWSPDSSMLGFVAGGALKTIELTGGQPRVLATGVVGATPGTWNLRGEILLSPRNLTLARVSAAGGEIASVTEVDVARYDENHLFPTFLPDGRHYLLQVRGGVELDYQLWVGELGTNVRRLLLQRASNARYAPPHGGAPAYLVFARDRRLLAQEFDAERLEIVGDVVTLVDNVAQSPTGGAADFSVSDDGVLAYRIDGPVTHEMAWYDRAGRAGDTIGDSAGNPRNGLRLSPDGKFLAFTRQGRDVQEVWVQDLERSVSSRLTFGGGRSPAWSPDSSQIAFLKGDAVMRKPAHGAGAEVTLWQGAGTLSVNDWSGDGAYLLITRWDEKVGRGLWLLPNPLSDSMSHEPEILEESALHGQFAPKIGVPRWVSYDDDESGTREVFVRTMPAGPPGVWQASNGGGNAPRWRADGRELYFLTGDEIVAVAVDGEAVPAVGPPRPLFAAPRGIVTGTFWYAPGYDVSADGARFVSTYSSSDRPPDTINVVVNWQTDLVP